MTNNIPACADTMAHHVNFQGVMNERTCALAGGFGSAQQLPENYELLSEPGRTQIVTKLSNSFFGAPWLVDKTMLPKA
jgi:hypothetical protein